MSKPRLAHQPYAPEILLGRLLYGSATGVFSSRKIERATSETIPLRFIAGNLHPGHGTLASFRATFLPELKDLFALSEPAGQAPLPDGLVVDDEIALRQERLARQAEAKAVLEARAAEQDALEAAEYAAKVQERAERARRKGRKPGGCPP